MKIWTAFLFLLLASCTPRWIPAQTMPLLSTEEPPDVIILTFSGRCSRFCSPPYDNWDYFATYGTLDRVSQAIEQKGYRVQAKGYSSYTLAEHQPWYMSRPQNGYLAALRDIEAIKPWLHSSHPPKIIVLAHSHGVVWANYFIRTHPEIPVALQVDIDGLCIGWKMDHKRLLSEIPVKHGIHPLQACEQIVVTPDLSVSAKDIVWPSVTHHLEVQSKRWPHPSPSAEGFEHNFLFDFTPNIRSDGTYDRLQQFISIREDHIAVAKPHSDSIAWILRQMDDVMNTWIQLQ